VKGTARLPLMLDWNQLSGLLPLNWGAGEGSRSHLRKGLEIVG